MEIIKQISEKLNIPEEIVASIYKEGFIRARDTLDSTIALEIASNLDNIIYKK